MRKWSAVVLAVVMVIATFSWIPDSPVAAQSGGHTSASISRIAFVSNRDGNEEIYAMNADGTGQVNLTQNPARDWQPVWSPDGTRIAFTTLRDGNEEIYVMNADGTGAYNLTNHPGPDNSPSWSPDGTRIAFASERNGWDIYTLTLDGGALQQITTDTTIKTDPSYSFDGQRLAYWQLINGTSEIFVTNADGTGNTLQLTSNNVNDGWPRWTSDGLIVFDTFRDGNWEIYVMNPDGSSPINLTRHPAADGRPAWSAYDYQIAFASDRTGNNEIYTIYPDGTGLRQLTQNAADDHSPIWQPAPDFTLTINGITPFVQLVYSQQQMLIQNPTIDMWMYLLNVAAVDGNGTRYRLDQPGVLAGDASVPAQIDRLPPNACIMLLTPAATRINPLRACDVIVQARVPNAFWLADFSIDSVTDDQLRTCRAATPDGLVTCIMPK